MTIRLYEIDPPLLSPADARFSAEVVSCEARGDQTAVVLDQTQFFPLGGGQPCDLGTISGRAVLDVVEEDEEVVHLLAGSEPIPLGAIAAEIDLARRRDHMEQHSGQHLLSAVLLRHGVETRSFHLGTDVTIDVAADAGGDVDDDLLRQVEAEVNAAIRDALPVVARLHVGADARAAATDLRKPPADAALTAPRGLRIVTFGPEEDPLDRDPCCGTHVDHTGRIGSLLILGHERGRKGELRIRFAAGGRALAAARERLDILAATCGVLTTGYPELPERAEKILGQVKQLGRDLKKAREQSLALEAKVLARAVDAPVTHQSVDHAEPSQLRGFAQAFLTVCPAASLVLTHQGAEHLTLAIARGPEAPTDPNAKTVLAEALSPLGGKGGGTPTFAQGAAPSPAAGLVDAAISAAIARLG